MLSLKLRVVTDEEWRLAAKRSGCVYLIRDADQDRVKIGYSMEPEKRLKALQTASSGKLHIVGLLAGSADAEKIFHRAMAGFAIRGEWFAASGVLKWLDTQTGGAPMRRCLVEIVHRTPVQVWWEWNAAAKVHIKHVWNAEQNAWVKADYSGPPNARPGWDATTIEDPGE